MSYSDTNDNLGCATVLVLACGLSVGLIILAGIAEVAAKLTGIDFKTVFTWEIGLASTLILVWMLLTNPLMRFSLLVTGTAIGMIVLLLALNGGDKEALDDWWLKALVTSVSVGIGAIYLFWDLKRHPLDKP